jgi:predicted GNAT family acetyltransferase
MKIIESERSIWFDGLTGYVFYVDETKKGEECIIHDLYVTIGNRKQGRGTWLVKEALKEIFKAGYKKAFVVVEDKTLIPFYQKLGFIQTSDNEMYYYKKQDNQTNYRIFYNENINSFYTVVDELFSGCDRASLPLVFTDKKTANHFAKILNSNKEKISFGG